MTLRFHCLWVGSLLLSPALLTADVADRAGLECAAQITQGGCTVERALELLSSAETPHVLYVKAGLKMMSGAPDAQNQANALIRRAAELGLAQAQFDLGMAALRRAEPVEAEKMLKAASDQSHVEARYALGVAYMLGDVLPQNWYEGSFLLEDAAALDHVDAVFQTGRLYLDGFGVAQDLNRAEVLFAKAGDLGRTDGYYEAAAAVLRHRSVDRDYGKSLEYALKAAAEGHAFAMILAGDILRDGPDHLRDDKAARQLFQEAAQSATQAAAAVGRERLSQTRGPSIADTIRNGHDTSRDTNVSTGAILFGTGMALMILGAQSDSSASGPTPYSPLYDHYSSTVNTWSGIGIGEVGRP